MMTEVVVGKTQTKLLDLFPISSVKLAALYLGVPLVLYLVYTLPQAIQEQFFLLYFQHPGFIQLLTNNYMHQLPGHLLSNVGYYLLVISMILILEKNLVRFNSLLFAMFSGVAIVTSAMTLVYFSSSGFSYIVGFSGIVAGLFGYFMFLVIEKLHSVTDMSRPHAFQAWAMITIVIFVLSMSALGITALYTAGHLSNGVGHLVGYIFGFMLAYIFR
jgi:membrane associated rhomboid family serine protease